MNTPNDKLTENICKVLDRSLNDLDPVTAVRLSQLKYRALDAAGQKKDRRMVWGAVPVTVVLLLIVLFNVPQQQRSEHLLAPGIAELNLLTSPEPLDFYTEDIEFYEWLSEIMVDEPSAQKQRPVVPAVDSRLGFSSGKRHRRNSHTTQSGTDRISWSIYG